jgi:hypothetical protein
MKLADLSKTDAWRADDQLPPGTYLMKIIEAEDGTSSGGNPQIVLDLAVVGGEWKGAEKRDWITVTEASLGRVVQVLQAFDYPIPEGEFELKVADLVGRTAEVVLRPESWTDREGNAREGVKVKGYRRPGTSSDVDNDASGFANGNGGTPQKDEKLPF